MERPNAELLRRAWAAYDRGDIEAFAACLTDDWREYGQEGEAGGFGTLEDERPTMEAYRSAFPDKHTEILQIIADDEMVECICTVSATHTGRYFDVEPTGSRLVVHEIMFNRVRDGRLATTGRWLPDRASTSSSQDVRLRKPSTISGDIGER